MAKALGVDIVDFYQNGWPVGYYNDDHELAEIEGALYTEDGEKLDLHAEYDLRKFGMIIDDKDHAISKPFAHFFQKWLAAKSTRRITIEVPVERVDEVLAQLKSSKLTVIN